MYTACARHVYTICAALHAPADALRVDQVGLIGSAFGLNKSVSASVCTVQARDRIAFIMCSTHKTLALGLPLFKVIFAGRSDLAVLCTPLLLQHPLQLIIGSILAPRLKKIAEAEDAGAP